MEAFGEMEEEEEEIATVTLGLGRVATRVIRGCGV